LLTAVDAAHRDDLSKNAMGLEGIPGEWSSTPTAVSLLDRLINRSVVVVTDGESYRMREARQRGGGRPTKKR
jgi:hypothetical protein